MPTKSNRAFSKWLLKWLCLAFDLFTSRVVVLVVVLGVMKPCLEVNKHHVMSLCRTHSPLSKSPGAETEKKIRILITKASHLFCISEMHALTIHISQRDIQRRHQMTFVIANNAFENNYWKQFQRIIPVISFRICPRTKHHTSEWRAHRCSSWRSTQKSPCDDARHSIQRLQQQRNIT